MQMHLWNLICKNFDPMNNEFFPLYNIPDWPSLTTVVVTLAKASTKPVIKVMSSQKEQPVANNKAAKAAKAKAAAAAAAENQFLDSGFEDYPAYYTTLPPLYPMTEFVMPYTNDAFYSTNFSPPLGTAVVADDDAQLVAGYVPVDDAVLLEMVRKQM
jgi:hypothetical protein